MSDEPKRVAIDPDDRLARHVGWTAEGRQFVLVTPSVDAAPGTEGCDFVALYVFDAAGALVEAWVDRLGPRALLAVDEPGRTVERRLSSLGDVERRRVEVAPFSVERFGTVFGLVAVAPGDEADDWSVELQPGAAMTFYAPWDSGTYDAA